MPDPKAHFKALVNKDVEPCDELKVTMDRDMSNQCVVELYMGGETFVISGPVNSVVRQEVELPQAVQGHQGQLGGDDVLIDAIC